MHWLIRRRPLPLSDSMIQKPMPVVAFKSHFHRNVGEPDFEGGSQGIRKKNRYMEAPPQAPRNREDGLLLLDFDHFIHAIHPAPKPCQFGRRQHRKMRVGASEFESPHGIDAHHRIAQPVRGACDNAKRIHCSRPAWKINAALDVIEEKRARCLPAIVNPKPIRRRDANLLLQVPVEIESELLGIVRRPRNFLSHDNPPAGKAIGINRRWNHHRIRAKSQRRHKRGSRAEAMEKRRPNPTFPCMLIDQHP